MGERRVGNTHKTPLLKLSVCLLSSSRCHPVAFVSVLTNSFLLPDVVPLVHLLSRCSLGQGSVF